VMTQAFKTESGQMTRLSISLAKQATYRVRAEGSTLKVQLVPAKLAFIDTKATETGTWKRTLWTTLTNADSLNGTYKGNTYLLGISVTKK